MNAKKLLLSPMIALTMLVFANAGIAQNASAVPKISGTYVGTTTTPCQIRASVKRDSFSTSIEGNFDWEIGTFTVTPSKRNPYSGTVSAKGYAYAGYAININMGGTPITKTQFSRSWNYTNTATTFTLQNSEGTWVFDIFYANVVSGVAHYATFGGAAPPNPVPVSGWNCGGGGILQYQ